MRNLIENANEWSNSWWDWLARASWEGAVVSGVVIVLIWVGKGLPAPARYGLLVIALLKFALPSAASFPTSLFNILGTETALRGSLKPGTAKLPNAGVPPRVMDESLEQLSLSVDSAMRPGLQRGYGSSREARVTDRLTWKGWLMLVHLFGSAVALCWCVKLQWSAVKLLRNSRAVSSAILNQQLNELSKVLKIRRCPRLLESNELACPAAAGLLFPSVVLPVGTGSILSEFEIRVVIAHELAHISRGDLRIKAAEMVLAAIWWFHPMLWIVRRNIREVREDCCDDMLLARGITSNESYGSALVSIARRLNTQRSCAALLGFGDNLHPLARRLGRIMNPGLRRAANLSVLNLAFLILLGGVLIPSVSAQKKLSIAPTPVDAITTLEQSKQRAAETQKRFEAEDRAMRARLGGPPVAAPDKPALHALTTDELRARLDGVRGGSEYQALILEEFCRREDALDVLLAKLQAATNEKGPDALDAREKLVELIGHTAQRSPGSDAKGLGALTLAVKDPSPRIARAAAAQLGALGRRAQTAFQVLAEALERGNSEAAIAIVRVVPLTDGMLNVMLNAFERQSRDPALQTAIVHALSSIDTKGCRPQIERTFLAAAPSADRRLRHKIAHWLLRFGSSDPATAAMIVNSIKNPERVMTGGEFADLSLQELIEHIRAPRLSLEDSHAASSLFRFRGEAVVAVPALIEWLDDSSRRRRSSAAGALANIGAGAKPAVPALLRFLNDHSEPGRTTALLALEGICRQSNEPMPMGEIIKALDDLDRDVCLRAVQVLGRCGAEAKAALPKIHRFLESDDLTLRFESAISAWQIDGTATARLIRVFVDVLEHPHHSSQKANAAEVLGQMGGAAASAVPALKRIAANEQLDPRTRQEAIKALARIEPSLNL